MHAAAIVVDGNNVIGTRPDGWWRDRAGAARGLLTRLQCYAAEVPGVVHVVFDALPPDVEEGTYGTVLVFGAERRGRDAADDRIVALVATGEVTAPLEVVTSDRRLAERVAALGATVVGARRFLEQLDAAGC